MLTSWRDKREKKTGITLFSELPERYKKNKNWFFTEDKFIKFEL